MQFAYSDNCFAVAEVTGPTHNLLRLGLALSAYAVSPQVVDLAPAGGANWLKEAELVSAVNAGVRQANEQLQKEYVVTRIEYRSDDSPPASRYVSLAYALIEEVTRRGGPAATGRW